MEAPCVRGKRKRPLCGWKRLVHCPTDETRATVGADEDMLGSVFCLVGLRRWVAGRIYWRLGCAVAQCGDQREATKPSDEWDAEPACPSGVVVEKGISGR